MKNYIQKLKRKYPISLFYYILFYNIVSLFLYHLPLFQYIFNNVDYRSFGGFIIITSCVIAFFSIHTLFFTFISFIHKSPVQFFSSLFFICNSIAFYFIKNYNVFFDKTMMGNFLNTDTNEATELFSIKIIFYLFFFGIIPSIVFYRLKITDIKFIKKIKMLGIRILLLVVWTFITSSSWLWFDNHSKHLGSLILPWSYSINLLRYKIQSIPQEKPQLLSDLTFKNDKPTLIVLVIGEASRKANYSLYGYGRKTNRLLSEQDNLTVLNAESYATYTTASIKCMLSHQGSKSGLKTYENLPSYLKRFGVKVLWRTDNWGEPDIDVDIYEDKKQIQKDCKKDCERLNYDEVLLYNLEKQIQKLNSNKTFVVLHQHGSHGPLYNKKYPKEFEYFTPTCKSVELQKCSQEELINAYDNTILYNDYFLNSLIEILKKEKKRVAMLYISDHGESLGENGFYLHGTPKSIAPKYQYEIPFFVWTNKEFRNDSKLKQIRGIYTQDYIFHSVLGAFQATSKDHKQQFNLFEIK